MSRLSAAVCVLLVVASLSVAAARRVYCERADPAWRTYRAPLVLEGRVRSVAADGTTTLQVHRAMKRTSDGWPRRDALLRLKVPTQRDAGCESRFEAPLRIGQNYIVFAERRGHAALAIGQPLKRTRRLLQRVRSVLEPTYPRAAKVQQLKDTRVQLGSPIRLECRASARPPPRITWYKNDLPVSQLRIKRLRVQNFRRRSVLIIRHSRVVDTGKYECRAQGAIGPVAVTSANITIQQPPTPPSESSYGAPCPMPDPSSYCLNGGTCLFFEQVQEPACKCPEGFGGQRCENKEVTNRSSCCCLAHQHNSSLCSRGGAS